MVDLSRPMENKIGEESISVSYMHACNVYYQVRSNRVSSYNDLKVKLTCKIKIQPVGMFISTSIHNNYIRYIAATEVKNQSTST